jgi:hypothetical protein
VIFVFFFFLCVCVHLSIQLPICLYMVVFSYFSPWETVVSYFNIMLAIVWIACQVRHIEFISSPPLFTTPLYIRHVIRLFKNTHTHTHTYKQTNYWIESKNRHENVGFLAALNQMICYRSSTDLIEILCFVFLRGFSSFLLMPLSNIFHLFWILFRFGFITSSSGSLCLNKLFFIISYLTLFRIHQFLLSLSHSTLSLLSLVCQYNLYGLRK